MKIRILTAALTLMLPLTASALEPFAPHHAEYWNQDVWSTRLADLDGDGDLDQLAAQQSGEAIWYENNGGALNTWPRRVIQADMDDTGHWWQSWSIFSADIDGDGDQDVIGGTGHFPGIGDATYAINWWENGGDGSSWTRHTIDIERRGLSVDEQRLIALYWAEPGDINYDGLLDIAIANYDDIEWAERVYDPTLDPPVAWIIHTLDDGACKGAHAAHPADLDLDPELEIVGACYYEGGDDQDAGVAVYRLTDPATGLDTPKYTLPNGLDGAFGVDTADFDADGDLDIVGTGSTEVRVWENDWTADQAWPLAWSGVGGAYAVAAGDMDGDAIPDIVAGDEDLTVYIGTGVLSRWLPEAIASNHGYHISSLVLGDYDGDGDRDIAEVGSSYSPLVSLWENGGTCDPDGEPPYDPYGGGGGYGGY